MNTAVFDAPGALRIEQRDPPQPGAGEALIRVGAAGLCAGDLYIFQGRNPYVTYPRVGGHEVAGVVEALGEGVETPRVGTRVVVEPFIGCGACYPCRVGTYNCCTRLSIVGVHRDGGFADRLVVPAGKLHPIPDGLSMRAASFAEPLAIGVQALRRGSVVAGETVLVLGCGPIGLAVVATAQARGCTVWATDPDAGRLATAVDLGAEAVNLGAVEGVPVVIEATGVLSVMEQALDLVAAGGRVVILCLARPDAAIRVPALDVTRREMSVLGSRASADCFPEALALLATGTTGLPDIATEVALEDAPDIFTRLNTDHGAMHKAVFMSKDVR